MSESSPPNAIELELEKLKIGTKPNSMEFSDLTDDAIGLIIDKLKIKERLILRKVSRGLRTRVDQKKSILKTLNIAFEVDRVAIGYCSSVVVYENAKCSTNTILRLLCNEGAKLKKIENYLKVALDDLQFAIKDPSVQLDALNFVYYPRFVPFQACDSTYINVFSEGLKNILKSLDHKVSTKRFSIHAELSHHIFDVLQYLKPGTLERIDFEEVTRNDKEPVIDQIVKLEQWKQATELGLKYDVNMWPEQYLMHFKKISVYLDIVALADVIKWRDFFSKLPSFEYGEMEPKHGFLSENIQNHLGDIVSTDGQWWDPIYIIHHPMTTDSNQVLEIKVKPRTYVVLFTKIARPSF